MLVICFFFNDTATTEIYTLALHDALPISAFRVTGTYTKVGPKKYPTLHVMTNSYPASKLNIDYSIRLSLVTPELISDGRKQGIRDRKSTRLNSSHANISYAVFCLKKTNNT